MLLGASAYRFFIRRYTSLEAGKLERETRISLSRTQESEQSAHDRIVGSATRLYQLRYLVGITQTVKNVTPQTRNSYHRRLNDSFPDQLKSRLSVRRGAGSLFGFAQEQPVCTLVSFRTPARLRPRGLVSPFSVLELKPFKFIGENLIATGPQPLDKLMEPKLALEQIQHLSPYYASLTRTAGWVLQSYHPANGATLSSGLPNRGAAARIASAM